MRLCNIIIHQDTAKLRPRPYIISLAVSSGCRFLRPLRLVLSSTGCCKSTAVLQEKSASDEAQRASDPLLQPDYFGVRQLVKMRDLYKQRVHWGHKEGVRNSYMTPYIFGSRLGVDIIDIEKSTSLLKDALNFTAHVAYQGGVILFISRSKQNMSLIEKTAVECGEYSHCRYWSGGVFTNASMQFGCVTRLPDLCIFINTLNNVFNQHAAVVHAAKMLIPSVGIVDTNCDPRLITYPVPGNDDTPCAVQYYCQLFSKAIKAGKAKRKEDDT